MSLPPHFSFILLIVHEMLSDVKGKLLSLHRNKANDYCIANDIEEFASKLESHTYHLIFLILGLN